MKPRHWILAVAILASTAYGLFIPNAKGFKTPELARILVTHVPCAFIATYFLVASAFFGIGYLRKKDLAKDVRIAATVEIGTIFALLTMATGIMFSYFQWGNLWENDPRQISFLLVCLFYIGLLALRSGFQDPTKKADVTAGYSAALLIPTVFLTFVFPRLPQVKQWSLHPTDTLQEGKLDGPYSIALLMSAVTLGWLAWEVYRHRVQVGYQLLEQEQDHAHLQTDRPDTAPDGVVRPVPVRSEDQPDQ